MCRVAASIAFVLLLLNGCTSDPIVSTPRDAGRGTSSPDAGEPFDAGRPPLCTPTDADAIPFAPAQCTPDTWCPMLDGQEQVRDGEWKAFYVVGDNDVWATGKQWVPGITKQTNVLSHWDGSQWLLVTDLKKFEPFSLWADAAGHAWVAGIGQIFFWNGTELVENTPPVAGDYGQLSGTSSDDLWVASSSAIFHWDGTTWNPIATPTPSLTTIAVLGPDEVYARNDENFWRWSGSAWMMQGIVANTAVEDLAARRVLPRWMPGGQRINISDDMWVVPSELVILQFLVAPSEVVILDNESVWAANYAGGFSYWDGRRWSEPRCGLWPHIRSVRVTPSGTIWAMDEEGMLLRWATNAQPQEPPMVRLKPTIIGGSSGSDVWVFDPSALHGIYSVEPHSQRVSPLGMHWDGTTWRVMPFEFELKKAITSFWAAAPDDAWMTFGGLVKHWDGLEWRVDFTANSRLNETAHFIHGLASDDVWAVGTSIAHWDGMKWETTPIPQTTLIDAEKPLTGMWALDSRHAWAWSEATCLFWDGETWRNASEVTPFVSWGIKKMGGTSVNDLWIWRNGGVYHWNGEKLVLRSKVSFEGSPVTISDALPSAPTPWVLGFTEQQRNIVLRWNGTEWETISAGKGTAQWHQLWSSTSDEIWAIGDASNVYRLQLSETH